MGFCCIRVDSISPSSKEGVKPILYSGSFAGFARAGNQVPLASLFVMEYHSPGIDEGILESLPYKAKPGSKAFDKIPQVIRDILMSGKSSVRQEKAF